MALSRWQRTGTRVLYTNRWWEYRRDDVRLPDGRAWEYNYVHTPGSVMLLPRLDDERFLLVRQYRYLNDTESVEFPAGGIRPGSSAKDSAMRELAEETGFAPGMLRRIGSFNPFNGVTDELCEVFEASDLSPAEATPDGTEEFELLRCTEEEIAALVRNGSIWDGMTLAAWMLYRTTC